ncbi:DUF3016 domain-containing protein [Aliidiomarina sanyensis]|uniref:DUF3016 domain-containing protein n=1 Tax=Aliidiomarina sanyensis TaxID=1249555 RepID=A0A432WAR6_9GAMM|nr:DUF3016 domain-containing protein [Aliidiomarina sanyensis]RUO27475.1 DUF3016 domain-containing protein [Aliidiomarina sanyensis]
MKTAIVSVITGLLFSMSVSAATVNVTWENPEKYRDIRSADQHQGRFQENLFAAFERKFTDLASGLPEDFTLDITVTDVDLAGNVETHSLRGQPQEVRIIRPGFYPRMRFSYTLSDAEGTIVQTGDENLRGRDMPGEGRLDAQARRRGVEMIEYEGAMLERWFSTTFDEDEIQERYSARQN